MLAVEGDGAIARCGRKGAREPHLAPTELGHLQVRPPVGVGQYPNPLRQAKARARPLGLEHRERLRLGIGGLARLNRKRQIAKPLLKCLSNRAGQPGCRGLCLPLGQPSRHFRISCWPQSRLNPLLLTLEGLVPDPTRRARAAGKAFCHRSVRLKAVSVATQDSRSGVGGWISTCLGHSSKPEHGWCCCPGRPSRWASPARWTRRTR